jgi:hypothetical protein
VPTRTPDTERIFASSGDWALGSDDTQWILYRRRSKERGGWIGVSFVRTERSILARCMREKGCLEDDRAVLLKGLPSTFDEWKDRSVIAPRSYFEHSRAFAEPGGARAGDDYPRLPADNPWASELPPEPTIDRSEDA